MDEKKDQAQTKAKPAQTIWDEMLRDAQQHQAETDRIVADFMKTLPPSQDHGVNLEVEHLANLDAACAAHAAAIDPLRAQIGPATDVMTLACLVVRYQDFLKQLAAFDPAALELSKFGRPHLSHDLKAHSQEAQMAIALLQSLSQARQGAAAPQVHAVPSAPPAQAHANPPAPPPQAHPNPPAPHPVDPSTPSLQTLTGIWDAALTDGRKGELAMAANGSFSWVILGAGFAFWGNWSLDRSVPSTPILALQRKGGYPINFYGPNGAVPLVIQSSYAWNITAFAPGRMNIGGDILTHRGQIAEASIQARISQIAAEYMELDARDRSNSQLFNFQAKCINEVQQAGWDYINSGVGRPKF